MTTGFTFSGKLYEFLKWAVLIALPAFSSLYFGLSEIYNWSNATQVVGTLALVTTFLGVLLGVSTKNFNSSDAKYDGVIDMQVDPSTGKLIYGLELNDDVSTLVDKSQVMFKLDRPTE